MAFLKTSEFFDDDRTWVFNRKRTRAAKRRQEFWYDDYDGVRYYKDQIDVWHVAANRWLATYANDDITDAEGRPMGRESIRGFTFSEDGREIVMQYAAGLERRETFPRHLKNRPEIVAYIEELPEALNKDQLVCLESLDFTGDRPSGSSDGSDDPDSIAYLLADAACRRFAPPAFDAAGLPDAARQLRALPTIHSQDTARKALQVCQALENDCDPDNLTELLSAAMSAINAAKGIGLLTAGGHVADVVNCAQKQIGEDREMTDAAIEFIHELIGLGHKIPLTRDLLRAVERIFVENPYKFSDLDMFKYFYRSEMAHILIDIRIGEVTKPSYEEKAVSALVRKCDYEKKALQVERKMKTKDIPWVSGVLASLNPFKNDNQTNRIELLEQQNSAWIIPKWTDLYRLEHEARKKKFSAFEKQVAHLQRGRDNKGLDKDYEQGTRLRRKEIAEKRIQIFEQKARDAEIEQLDYERLARELGEKTKLYDQYVRQRALSR